MDKKLIIVLLVILFALIGITFIIGLIISGNPSEGENKTGQENVPQTEETIDSELFNLKNIIENVKISKGGYEYLYDDEGFLNSVNKLKAMGAVNIISNINPLSQTYCLTLFHGENNISSCIDNNFIGTLETSACDRNNIICVIPQNEEVSETTEEVIPENNDIVEEDDGKEVEEEEVPELVLTENVTVGNTTIARYKNNEQKEIIFINEKEYGPYSETYIMHNESEWGLAMNYNGKWYVNINGKAVGPYTQKPTIEFYDESLGFSYIKDDKYYVKIGDEIYGPYDDLLEFDLNNK